MAFGGVSKRTGSQRLAILAIGAFFPVGMALLSRVDETQGKAASRIPVREVAG